MVVVHVDIEVVPGTEQAFLQASLANARASVLEPLIARFDVLQHPQEPTHFLLVEAYRSEEGPVQHKTTAHYLKWKEEVETMMARPRTSIRWQPCHFPPELP